MRLTLNSEWFPIAFGFLISSALLVISADRAASDADDGPAKSAVPSAIQAPDTIKVDREAAKQMGIRVEPVTRKPLSVGLKTTGQIEALPNQKVAVTAPIQGTVVRLLIQPNDPVQAGQVVALLSSPELSQLRVDATQKRDEAEAGLEQARADLKLAQQNYTRQRQQAIADLKQTQTQVALAQERYDRNRELQAAGAVTRRQVQESDAELAAARATFTKAQSQLGELEAANQLTRAQAGVAVAESRLRLSDAAYRARLQQLKTAANSDGLVRVTAPISGTVADRPITPGETVTVEAASKQLMTIVNTKRVWATANVYEKDLARVEVGQAVRVTVASLPNRIFAGRVAQIGTMVEGNTRVVPIKVELDNPQHLLKPGMFAELEIVTEQTPVAVLAIPSTAVVDNNGTSRVFVQQGDGFRAVAVTLGQTAGQWVEVKAGIKASDRIVTEGAPLLYAQSLGGAGIPTDDDKPGADKKSEHDLDDVIRGIQIPIWLGLPAAAAIAGGAFWIGRKTQKRSMRPTEDQSTQNHPTFELPSGFDGIPFAGVKPKPTSDNSTNDASANKSQRD
jgi:cobalt-zinc-cadmium efflux system membrane fusion protein